MSAFSLLKLVGRVPDEAAAYRYLEDLRWGTTELASKLVCRLSYKPLNGKAA